MDLEKMRYESLPSFTHQEALDILENGSHQQRVLLPFALGEYEEDQGFAQMVCLRSMEHPDPEIRSAGAMGLAYIARNHKKLDKRVVKPYLLRELRGNHTYRWRIQDALEDINWFLGWRLGEASENKKG